MTLRDYMLVAIADAAECEEHVRAYHGRALQSALDALDATGSAIAAQAAYIESALPRHHPGTTPLALDWAASDERNGRPFDERGLANLIAERAAIRAKIDARRAAS